MFIVSITLTSSCVSIFLVWKTKDMFFPLSFSPLGSPANSLFGGEAQPGRTFSQISMHARSQKPAKPQSELVFSIFPAKSKINLLPINQMAYKDIFTHTHTLDLTTHVRYHRNRVSLARCRTSLLPRCWSYLSVHSFCVWPSTSVALPRASLGNIRNLSKEQTLKFTACFQGPSSGWSVVVPEAQTAS